MTWTRCECPECDGTGKVQVSHPHDPLDSACMADCGDCGGSGYPPDDRCAWCRDSTELGWDLEQGIHDDICLACWHGRQEADRKRDHDEARGDYMRDQERDREMWERDNPAP